MIYKLQNGRTIPLGGDYLEYLQSIPETYGGSIQPSIKVESLPKKFNGSQQAARTYAEGYQKGAKPVTKAIDNAGQKIFNTTKNVAMFVPGPTGAITWLGQMGADTANGEYSKVAKDLGAAVLIGAGLKGAQVGAKSVGRTLAGKGVNIPWLDAYDYSALRNEYLNRAAKRTRIITPNKGWENLSNFDVYKDAFYNHPAVETTETITEIPKHYTDTVGNIEDIHKLKMHPNSAIETGYVNFIDDTKPFRKDLKGEYDIYRDGTTYMNGHPTKQGVLRQDLSGNEFLEYPRNSGVRYYTGHIKTEGYTPTLVHIGYPNMSGTVINPRIDPMKRLDKNYLWWQRNNPFWSHGNFTTRINDIVPSESAIDISRDFPTRLTDAIDLSDPKLDIVQMEFNPLTKTFGRVKYHIPQSTISPQEAVTTYHFDGRMPLTRPISEAELKGWPKQFRNQRRGQISASEYSGLPKGERNNGRYGDIRFIRHMDIVPELTEDGFVQIAPKENWLANFTTDQLMVPHKSYPVEGIGKNVLVISPEAFRGTTPFSLDPGDSFFINRELKIKPKHVTFISGDPQSIQLAKERGFNVETSPKLKILSELSKQATWEELQTMRPALEKRGYWFHGREYPKIKSDYVDELNRVLHTRFNRPSLKDYSNIESVTGVPTHTYSRSTAPQQSFFGPKTGYQQAIYDTTPQIEHDLMKQIGSYAHPMAESMEGYSPLFFRLLKGWIPIKKQGGKI